jgi:hypothetical protein
MWRLEYASTQAMCSFYIYLYVNAFHVQFIIDLIFGQK